MSGDPATGGNLVGTSMASMTDRRRPELLVARMGARIMTGLTGNMDLPRLDTSGSANWVAEHTNSTRSEAGFGKKTMSPKHVTAEYEISRNMTLQSNEALNSILQSDLRYLLRQSLDGAAISGGGTHEPVGVMSDPDVENLQGLDNAIDSESYMPLHFSDHINKMMIALDLDDVSGTRAFLMSRKVRAYSRQLRYSDDRLMTPKDIFHEKPNFETSQMPDNLGASNDQSGLIFGEWASLYLGYWSGIDILPNPYHSDVASKGGLLLHAFLDADVVVRHPEAFVHTLVATGL